MKEQQDSLQVALYAREIRDRHDAELSVATQLAALREYAEKNGYEVVGEYIDEDESGLIPDAPQFQRMIDEARSPKAEFRDILVWQLSRFTRKPEYVVALKLMLRRRGVHVVSIKEDDSDKRLEGLIEGVDELHYRKLSLDVSRGMREAASRGFWMSSHVPYGYNRVMVQDGPKKRPKLEPDKATASIVKRIFDMAEAGKTTLDVTRTLNSEGIVSPRGKLWSKTSIHGILTNEAYAGTLLWGANAKHKGDPVRVENAFPAIVSKARFLRVRKQMNSRAPKFKRPRRIGSSYLLSGLVKCETCGSALTGQSAKSGQYSYYVCQSISKRGNDACTTFRLNAHHLEELVVEQIRSHVITDSIVGDMVRLLNEEIDAMLQQQRERLESMEGELVAVRRWLDRLYSAIETTDLDTEDIAPRIREHRDRERRLQDAVRKGEDLLSMDRAELEEEVITAVLEQDTSTFLKEGEFNDRRTFVESFVKEIKVSRGQAKVLYTMPMPLGSRIAGMDAEEMVIQDRSLSAGNYSKARGDASEFGDVTISSIPRPDSEERLRRLFTLLLENAPSTGE